VRGGALPLGPSPGHAWSKSRFAGPHLRDDLLDRGVVVETLETATTWSNLERLYGGVRAALAGFHVGCHISHLYPSGASLYFTVLGRQAEEPVVQWQAMNGAVSMDDARRYAVLTTSSFDTTGEVAVHDLQAGTTTIITSLNADVLAESPPANWERFEVQRGDFTIEVWLLTPPNFDPSRNYPLVLDIHGGPQGFFGYTFRLQQHCYCNR